MSDENSAFQCPQNLSLHVFMLFTTYTNYQQLSAPTGRGILDCLGWAATNAATLPPDIFSDQGLFAGDKHGPAERSFITHFMRLNRQGLGTFKHGQEPSLAAGQMLQDVDSFLQACELGVKDLARSASEGPESDILVDPAHPEPYTRPIQTPVV